MKLNFDVENSNNWFSIRIILSLIYTKNDYKIIHLIEKKKKKVANITQLYNLNVQWHFSSENQKPVWIVFNQCASPETQRSVQVQDLGRGSHSPASPPTGTCSAPSKIKKAYEAPPAPTGHPRTSPATPGPLHSSSLTSALPLFTDPRVV